VAEIDLGNADVWTDMGEAIPSTASCRHPAPTRPCRRSLAPRAPAVQTVRSIGDAERLREIGYDESRFGPGEEGAFACWYGRDGVPVGVASHLTTVPTNAAAS